MADELAPVAVVLTQIATPEALAAVCALQRLDVDAVPTPIGAVAVCRDAAPGAAADVALDELPLGIAGDEGVQAVRNELGQVDDLALVAGAKDRGVRLRLMDLLE